ncbi:hypothetical protein Pint_22652 [Pistacia integerrima]|uniref:Uncharacterized protein n=1 Tax=Pistacia integerrima TaxID=434235 RepID=A0ACC0YIX0_9ROSI|nr:hypothetical protein Pint_22652 [Pistacia integerrima]
MVEVVAKDQDRKEDTTMKSVVLTFTGDKLVLLSSFLNAIRELGNEAVEHYDPHIIMQASSLIVIPLNMESESKFRVRNST